VEQRVAQHGEPVSFASGTHHLVGECFVPSADDQPPPWAGVVVLHEAFGLTDDIRVFGRRFADLGYLTLAPDLYSWGLTVRCIVSAFRSMFNRSGPAFDDIDAARALLASDPRCTSRIGVIGFCQGGGFALAAATSLDFDAASVNYGLVPKDADRALAGACPIVGSFGGKDRMTKGKTAALSGALARLGIDHDVKEYPDAGHSFLNDNTGWMRVVAGVGGGGFHEPSADDAWDRITRFFDRHLRDEGASPPPPPSDSPR
jgi:carboxymethylenebutenolidase